MAPWGRQCFLILTQVCPAASLHVTAFQQNLSKGPAICAHVTASLSPCLLYLSGLEDSVVLVSTPF